MNKTLNSLCLTQRMKNEMPLEPEQLEQVFDSLDADGACYLLRFLKMGINSRTFRLFITGNGFLTFDEFIAGFGKRNRQFKSKSNLKIGK